MPLNSSSFAKCLFICTENTQLLTQLFLTLFLCRFLALALCSLASMTLFSSPSLFAISCVLICLIVLCKETITLSYSSSSGLVQVGQLDSLPMASILATCLLVFSMRPLYLAISCLSVFS